MYAVLLVLYITSNHLTIASVPMKDMATCWAQVAKTDARTIPDYATLTCVPLRDPKGT